MTKTFKLNTGEISFDEDKIIIKDDAKRQRWIMLLIMFFTTINGIFTFLRYPKSGREADFWFGIIIVFVGILALILWLLRSVKSEIPFNAVKSMKVKRRFRNKFLDIKLKNNKLRRVIRVDNEMELKKYIETNFWKNKITVANG